MTFWQWLARVFDNARLDKPQPVEVVPLSRPPSFFTSDAEGTATRERVLQAVQERSMTITPASFRTYQGGVGHGLGRAAPGATTRKRLFQLGSSIPDAQLLWYREPRVHRLSTLRHPGATMAHRQSLPHPRARRHPQRLQSHDQRRQGADATAILARLTRADKKYRLKRTASSWPELSNACSASALRCSRSSPRPRPEVLRTAVQPRRRYARQLQGHRRKSTRIGVSPSCRPTPCATPRPATFTSRRTGSFRASVPQVAPCHFARPRGPRRPQAVVSVRRPVARAAHLRTRVRGRAHGQRSPAARAVQARHGVLHRHGEGPRRRIRVRVERLLKWTQYRDNHGVKVADKDGDKVEQHDTALRRL
jgi:hypothetical protein